MIDRDLLFDRVLAATAAEFGVGRDLLLSRARPANVALARHVAYWVCHRYHGWPLPECGRRFDRDHSTILHGVRRIDRVLSGLVSGSNDISVIPSPD